MKNPYKNLEDAARKRTGICGPKKFNYTTSFPCPHCSGAGTIQESMSDYRHPGIYRNCKDCNKTGIFSYEQFKAWYDALTAFYKDLDAKDKRAKQVQANLRSKLTAEEVSVLKKYGTKFL